MSLEEWVQRTTNLEQEADALCSELARLQHRLSNDNKAEKVSDADKERVERLRKENSKLNYRLNILQRAIQEERANTSNIGNNSMEETTSLQLDSVSPVSVLSTLFKEAVLKAFPDLPLEKSACFAVTVASAAGKKQQGDNKVVSPDYQFNGAMSITAHLKAQGQGKNWNPRSIAEAVVSSLSKAKLDQLVSRVQVAGPGFVNIWLNKSFVGDQLKSILKEGVKPPSDLVSKRLRVIVDFSSPNIAKEMHVGHLRSTIIGDSIANLAEFLGHDVLRLNHVGDWGTQFGMLIAHLQDTYPNYLESAPPLGDLTSFYRDSKKRFDEDADFKKRAYEAVVQLQAHNADHIKAWNLICDVSRKEFERVYKRLGVKNLVERGESFYQERMKRIVKLLDDKKLLEEDEGRKIMFAPGHKVPLTIEKSGGGYTYDTSDMAALEQRIVEEKADRIIYETDLGQGPHFDLIFACGRRANILTDEVRVDHVGHGLVLGEDKKKFKTRSGESIKLTDLLDEALDRSMKKLLEKERDKVLSAEELQKANESVAYGCIKYADLAHSRTNDYVFSFDKMLEDKGNTAVYMLYAYTRICSIGRGANITSEQIVDKAKDTPFLLEHEKEWKLGKLLLRFLEVVAKVWDDLFMHSMCEYMYEVATVFSEFYDNCYCVEKNEAGEIVKVNTERLMLCEATARVLNTCFHILGIEPVQRM